MMNFIEELYQSYFYDILKAVAKKYEFEYPEDKMIELSKEIKKIIDDKSKYTDYLVREDIKANLQFDLAVILDEYGYPPVTIDDVYKEVLEQAENFKKYAEQQKILVPLVVQGFLSYAFNSNFLARINKLLSIDGISLERGSFIYSTSGLKSGFTD